MTIFDTAIDTLFNDDNMAVDAIYTPVAGGPVSVRVILTEGVEIASAGFSDVSDRRTVVGIRNSEIDSPGRGDTILVGAITYTVDVILEDDGYSTEVAVK